MTSLFISSFFLGIAFCAPPGIVAAETIRRGLAHGFRSALLVQFGSLVGDSTWAAIALTGLAFIIQNWLARSLLMLVGLVLLTKLALEALRDAWQGTNPPASPDSQRGDFATGAVLSLSNPMNIIFWTGIGATAFASLPGTPQPIHFVVFFIAFLSGSFVWCFFLAGLVAWGRRYITPTFFRAINLLCGLLLGEFGLQLGWQLLMAA